MAAPPASAQIISPFPAPPVYARLYASEAIALQPAPLPPTIHADFVAFGEEYHLNDEVIRPLSETGIRQLYVNKKEWKAEMKKLNSSAVAAFVDLISMLIASPDNQERTDKLNDIRDIFINMHHLINEFRPIQGRDTLRMMQQKQLGELETSVDDFKDFLAEAKKTFRQSLKMDEVARIPIPAYRHDLEGPEVVKEEEKQQVQAGMATTVRGGERRTIHSSTPRPEQLLHMLQRRRNDEALWNDLTGGVEKMELL
ncbi:hypothetical protein PFISCL1PPCAC_18298 [Pristionchus fissidentatus]|uniref:Mediator of RNA polymerase II transcription subunit 7 n=1 Tax=Pristionchus fissidentatus TaxID=1538716 RepID=A0AAV5W487_9BILA|nr:hypothetical protein PFISCL1PPCAC_18298 [Pristionchus fissidentatus]